jgi:hypothetical protein
MINFKNTKIFLLFFFVILVGIIIFYLDNNEEIVKNKTLKSGFMSINYDEVKVDALIDLPENNTGDVLLAFHGTTMDDSKTMLAAEVLIEKIRKMLNRKDLIIISVAYPQENILIGDNMKEVEAALLWTKNRLSEEFKVEVNKIYLFGHSLGGYLVTRLNTMHKTDGVIANAPGPLDLVFRCSVIERNNSKIREEEIACSSIYKKYGSVFTNPTAYKGRSLINFSSGYKSKILFVQGMDDKKIQMELWPVFKENILECSDCAEYIFLEPKDAGHNAAFQDERAIEAINDFLE